MNKVQRAVKHVSVTFFFAFLWRCHLNLQLHIWRRYIWWLYCKCHLHMWTPILWGVGVYLTVLLPMSYAHWNPILRGYIWWLCCKCHMHMWTPIPGGISDGSGANVIWMCELQWGVYMTDVIWKFEFILGFTLASQRSFLWKTNKILHASHDFQGHFGATKLHHFLKRLYYFQGNVEDNAQIH